MRVITARKLIGALIAADSGDLDAEDLGVVGQSLETVRPQIFEDEPGAHRKVSDCAAGQYLTRSGHRSDSRTDTNRNAAPLLAALLALADVHTGADRDAVGGSAGTRSKPHRAAFVGPSKRAKMPSPVCLARRPPYL